MNRTIAQAVSVIFHPGILPTYFFIFLGLSGYNTTLIPISGTRSWLMFTVMVFFITFLVPVLAMVVILSSGLHPRHESAKKFDFSMNDRRERVMPFFFTSIFYIIVAYFLMKGQQLGLIVGIVMRALAISVVLTTVITFFFKVSVHAVGMSGILGLLLLLHEVVDGIDFTYPIMGVIVLLGLVMTARLALQAHDMLESLVGTAVGLISCFGISFLIIKGYFYF